MQLNLVILLALSATAAYSQSSCDDQAACEEAARANPRSSLAHFRLGEICFALGDLQSAANHFHNAIAADQDPKWTVVWSHLNLGKIFDAVDTRNRALNEYRKALQTGDNTRGALDEATKYLAEPFRRP
jgi:tetratricopeptide (TPR) repeat protein